MKKGRRTAGHPAHRDLTREHLTVLKQFESWLAQSDEIAAPTPAEESAFFVGVLLLGQQMRLNLRRPTDVEEIIEFLLDRDDEADEDIVEMTLDVLHDYIHFRLQTAGSDAWEAAHETIIAAFGPDDPAADALARAVADGQALSETERRAGLAATLVVERVRDLLRWVGSGRAVAPSGGVRRADISTVASMLGVAAVGVIGAALEKLTARGVVRPEDFPLARYLYRVVTQDEPLNLPWGSFFGGEPVTAR